MSDNPEVYERINMLEITSGRMDERIKVVEEIAKDVKAMRVQLGVIVILGSLAVQVVFHFWK